MISSAEDLVLSERKKRLLDTFKNVPLSKEFPLLLEIPIDKSLFAELSLAMSLYILASLKCFNPAKSFELSKDFLEKYRQAILTLPNRTPNGKIEPKKELALEFNLVERAIEKIFKTFQIDESSELMQFPVSVRIQDGRPSESVESRHYSTSKMHSDIWTGEPAICCAVIVPVLGDVAGTGVEFYEPKIDATEEYVKVYDDYLLASRFSDGAKKYDCLMKPAHVYIFDSYCLHKTLKQGGGVRVSVDFRFTFKQPLKSDLEVNSDRLKKYVSVKDWYTEGNQTFIVPTDTAEGTLKKFIHSNPKDAPKVETEYSLVESPLKI